MLDPTADENLDRIGGRGLLLIRSFMDEISYNQRGNEVTLVKYSTDGRWMLANLPRMQIESQNEELEVSGGVVLLDEESAELLSTA